MNLGGKGSKGVAATQGEVTFDDILAINMIGNDNSAIQLSSLHDTPTTIKLNKLTNIFVSGDYSDAIRVSGGELYIDGPMNISTNNNAHAIEMTNDTADIKSTITTRNSSNLDTPNPQKIRLKGKIQLSNRFNQVQLDLAEGSFINSQLNINGGNVGFNLHSPHSKWITVLAQLLVRTVAWLSIS